MTFTLLPAVDVADGRPSGWCRARPAPRPRYGDPLEAALAWQRDGAEWVHLVDLDAAFGRGSNAALLAEVVGALDVEGRAVRRHPRRRVAAPRRWPPARARVNIGTAALEDPEWCDRAIAEYGDRVAVGLDVPRRHAGGPRLDPRRRRPVRGAGPAGRGRLRPLRGHRHRRDGTMTGPNLDLLRDGVRGAPTRR